jgi:hypothetical protein
VLSEKKFLNETKNHNPPPLQVKWSVPKWKMARKGNFFINDIMKTNGNGLMSVEELGLKYQITNACMVYNNLLRDRPYNLKGGLWFFYSFIIFFSDNTSVTIFFCFVCIRSESCFQCCLFLWMVHSWLPFQFSPTIISDYIKSLSQKQTHWSILNSSILHFTFDLYLYLLSP